MQDIAITMNLVTARERKGKTGEKGEKKRKVKML